MDYSSFAQANGIYALEKNLICDTIGVVQPEKMLEIRNRVSEIFSPDYDFFSVDGDRAVGWGGRSGESLYFP
ncbi:hypothetical protein, partial [Methanoregula sp.]|uniref:hypothetical protein n=1 Tax=Methanoregula sp. TaxID=2052170 RepID=UPI000CB30BC8